MIGLDERKRRKKQRSFNDSFSYLTSFDLHNIETSKQRINVERITKSFDGSLRRGNDDDAISSAAKVAKLIGTLKRINCSH